MWRNIPSSDEEEICEERNWSCNGNKGIYGTEVAAILSLSLLIWNSCVLKLRLSCYLYTMRDGNSSNTIRCTLNTKNKPDTCKS